MKRGFIHERLQKIGHWAPVHHHTPPLQAVYTIGDPHVPYIRIDKDAFQKSQVKELSLPPSYPAGQAYTIRMYSALGRQYHECEAEYVISLQHGTFTCLKSLLTDDFCCVTALAVPTLTGETCT